MSGHRFKIGHFAPTGAAPCGAEAPLFPLVHLLPHLFPFSLLTPTLQVEWVAPRQPFFSSEKIRLMFRTVYNSAQIFLLFCHNIHTFDGLTDRRTDGQNSHRYAASAFHVARQKLRWQSAAIMLFT